MNIKQKLILEIDGIEHKEIEVTKEQLLDIQRQIEEILQNRIVYPLPQYPNPLQPPYIWTCEDPGYPVKY